MITRFAAEFRGHQVLRVELSEVDSSPVSLRLSERAERKKISRKFFRELSPRFVSRTEFFFRIGARGATRKVSLGWEECRRGMSVVERVGEKSAAH